MYQGPPPITPPGLAPVMIGSGGMGAQYGTAFSHAQQHNELAGGLAGARAGDFIGNSLTPSLVHGGAAAAMFAAPIMAQQGGLVGLAGRGLNAMDPMSHMGSFFRFGFGFGRGGKAMAALRGAKTAGTAMRALPAVLGAGAVGIGAAMVPLAASLAATEGLIKVGEQVAHGAQERFTGAALMESIGSPFGGSATTGSGVGRMLGEMGRDVGKSVSEMADMVRDMDQMKLFQTTRSVKEFKERMSEIMSTVKEVATTMQSSVDDALKMVGEMRTQGFYTSSDIKAATLRQEARSSASGLSTGQMVQAGRFGTQYARALGMRGRFGSDFAQQQTAAVSYAVRQGLMSEEDVMERGGIEQVGANLAATQMRFLRTSRGRVMIANMLGGGTEMDMGRVNRMLSGNMTLESMVTGAAGRGLGALTRAGTSEARENAMQYAGMGMVSIAAAQSRQLYGGYNQNGIIRMLGTMGVGRTDARLLLQQTMAMPEMLEAEDREAYTAQQRAAYSDSAAFHSLRGGVSRYLYARDRRHFGRGIFREAQEAGRSIGVAAGGIQRNVSRLLGAPIEYSGGGAKDQALANAYSRRMARGATGSTSMDFDAYEGRMFGDIAGNFARGMGSTVENATGGVAFFGEEVGEMYGRLFGTTDVSFTGRLRGPPGAREQIRTEYEGHTVSAEEAWKMRQGGTQVMNLGGGRFITEAALKRAKAVERNAGSITEDQRAALGYLTGGSSDAVSTARAVLENTRYAVGDSSGLSEDARNAFELAAASDKLSGTLGTSKGMLGTMTLDEYVRDKDAQLALKTRLAREKGIGGEYISRREGRLKSLGAEKEDFDTKMDEMLDVLGVRSHLGMTKGAALRDELSSNEGTRAAFADILKAYQMKDGPEKVKALQAALAGAEGLGTDGGAALVEMMERAKSEGWMAEGLKGLGADGLKAIERYSYSQHRGNQAGRVTGKIKDLIKKGTIGGIGGEHAAALKRLSGMGDTPEAFGQAASALGSSILRDGIDADEEAMLQEVFGNAGVGFKQTYDALMAGDQKTIDKYELGLKGSDLEKMDDDAKRAAVAAALEKAGMTDITGYSAASGKNVGDTRTEYVQANTRFVAAVNKFVGNLKQAGVGGSDVWDNDYSELLKDPQ